MNILAVCHRLKIITFAFVVSLLTTMTACAQSSISLEDLEGEWRSGSPAFGQSASSTLSLSLTLGGKFHRLDYSINMVKEKTQSLMFQGTAHYRLLADGRYDAFWADSSGDLHPIKARAEGNAIIADWGISGAKQGSTKYQLNSNGTLTVTDMIKRDDKWVQFNKMEFARVNIAVPNSEDSDFNSQD